MNIKVLTVCVGGGWKTNNGECLYIGDDVNSKAFLLEEDVTLDGLKKKIVARFAMNSQPTEINLSHLHPTKKVTSPLTIETDEDLKSFYQISNTPQTAWGLPIYVTINGRRKRKELATENMQLSSSVNNSYQPLEMYDAHENAMISDDDDEEVDHPPDSQFVQVGQLFGTKEDLKTAIYNQAIKESYGFKVHRSRKDYYSLICVHKECEWQLVASKLKGLSYFEVKKFNENHTCPFEVRCSRHVQPPYQIIAQKIKISFDGVNKGPDPSMIMNDMRNDYLQNISYWKAWKAQQWAQVLIRGSPEENYEMLPSYCHMIKRTNQGTYTCLEVESQGRFKYIFVSIGASIRGFNQLRKVIQVDGTHLHNKYLGVLITASAQDAIQHIYPLAYAIVDSENDKAWKWFFDQLLTVIPCSSVLVFVSDRHLSIEKSVESVYRCAKHVICIRHLKQNLITRFKEKGIAKLFKQATESYTMPDFNKYFQDICSKNPDMGQYLRDAGLEKWSRVHFNGDRYNIMTTNNSKSLNNVLKQARSFPIVALLELIRELLSRWFAERKQTIQENTNQLPPTIHKILELRCKKSKRYGVKVLNNSQFEVFSGDFSGVVNLAKKTCSCRMFDLEKIPCGHALAAIQQMQYPLRSFINGYYQFEAWSSTYEDSIYSLPPKIDWDVPVEVKSTICHPPNVRRMTGRPKRKRIPSKGEFNTKRSKNAKKDKVSAESSNTTNIIE